MTSPGTTHFRASLGLLAFIFELILMKMEMMIDILAKGWLYPLKGAPKPLGELRPVVVLLERTEKKVCQYGFNILNMRFVVFVVIYIL